MEDKSKYKPNAKSKEIVSGELVSQPSLVQQSEVILNHMYREIDRMDDDEIISSLAGRMTDKVCYEFEVKDKSAAGGKRLVSGIGWKGAIEIAQATKNIGADPNVKPTGDISQEGNIRVTVYCKDFNTNVGFWGSSYAPAKKKVWNYDNKCYDEQEDPHAFIKAMNKAQRNGILNLLSNNVKEEYINLWKKGGKITRLEAPKNVPVNANNTVATPQIKQNTD